MSKKIILLTTLIIATLLLTSTISASTDDLTIEYTQHDLNISNITFIYKDTNTTQYQGDQGLDGAIIKNSLDNKTYYISVNLVRGLAYKTQKTFNFDQPLKAEAHDGNGSYDYYVETLAYQNGTKIRPLSISDDDLTQEEKTYFDDYEDQKQDYYHKQDELAQRSAAVDEMSEIKHQNKPRNYYYSNYGYGGYVHEI